MKQFTPKLFDVMKMLNKFDLYSYIIIGEAGLILLILFIVLVSSIARKKKLTKKSSKHYSNSIWTRWVIAVMENIHLVFV